METLISGIIIYILLLVFKRIFLKRKLNKSKTILFNYVRELYGEEGLETLKEKRMWKNMPTCLLYYTHGLPNKKKNNETSKNFEETWYYKPIRKARKNAKRKFKIEIYSRNGFITDWSKQK